MAHFHDSKLNTILQFCKAAQTLSFTTAAELIGTTPSAVSKAVRRLEDQLCVKLFVRTTRAIRLTPDGASYYATCSAALKSITDGAEVLAGGRTRPHGTLRLSLPASYGIVDVVPRLPQYIQMYEGEVKVLASVTNSVADFVTHGFDLAVRIGRVADSRLVARRLRDAQVKVVASSAYLARHGIPRSPDDLTRRDCIDMILPDTQRAAPWEFRRAGRAQRVAVNAALVVDHPLAAVSAAVAGGGFARLLDFTVAREIESGGLVEVLPRFRPPAVPVSIVYPGHRHLSVNVRTFIDFMFGEQSGAAPATR